jgi:hypothetical protein
MSHRFARLCQWMPRFRRRRRCAAVSAVSPSGPTVHQSGHQPPTAAGAVALFGIGVGSCGMLALSSSSTEAGR